MIGGIIGGRLMNTAIAVFCKTPGLSPTKTRLGADIGSNFAEEFYRGSIAAIEEVLITIKNHFDKTIDVYWALAEKEALDLSQWSNFPSIWTGIGGLGDRIYHVFSQLFEAYDQVIIIGSDSPQITKSYLVNAIRKLSQDDCDGVVGPCRDGGFVLFGCKKPISKSIWNEVKYSQEDTLKQLLTRLDQENYIYKMIPTLGDVDDYDDLLSLLNDFVHMELMLLPKQKYLYQWIQRLLISKIYLRDINTIQVSSIEKR
jgi:rSAM/selenodomain-associated transferase 1